MSPDIPKPLNTQTARLAVSYQEDGTDVLLTIHCVNHYDAMLLAERISRDLSGCRDFTLLFNGLQQ